MITRPIYPDQKVNYVDAERKIRSVDISEVVSPTTLHLNIAKDHVALAEYNDDKATPNTWHFPDESPAPAPAKQKSFEPGKAASA